MPKSLLRTWLAVGLAAVAVLVVGLLAQRDFVGDVFATCPGALDFGGPYSLDGGALEPVVFDTAEPPAPTATVPSFALRYDQKTAAPGAFAGATEYANVRLVWSELGADGRTCTCGTVPLVLSAEAPYDLRLYRVGQTDRYVVKGRARRSTYVADPDVRAGFRLRTGSARHLQRDRVFTMRHASVVVTLVALGALVVALLRSRRAMSYALRLHAWTEARLTPAGLLEDESGAVLGTLQQARSRFASALPPGPVLIAPSALKGSQLYRDMPIIARADVAEGTHARWSAGTMLRLRDARVLAILSTACTLLAFGARLLA